MGCALSAGSKSLRSNPRIRERTFLSLPPRSTPCKKKKSLTLGCWSKHWAAQSPVCIGSTMWRIYIKTEQIVKASYWWSPSPWKGNWSVFDGKLSSMDSCRVFSSPWVATWEIPKCHMVIVSYNMYEWTLCNLKWIFDLSFWHHFQAQVHAV